MHISLLVDEILIQCTTAKSKAAYDKAWNDFMAFHSPDDTKEVGVNLLEMKGACERYGGK